MSAPQIKERPASKLRTVFASLGSLLSGKDKKRATPAPQAPAAAGSPAKAAPASASTAPETITPESTVLETTAPETTAPETSGPETTAAAEPEPVTVAEPEPGVTVADAVEPDASEPEDVVAEVVVVETVEPAIVVVETVDPETGEPEIVVTEVVVDTVQAVVVELPLTNYDDSSVASLRARLRNLSVEQLTQLLEYEKSHAARADVISMFERRIAKVQAEG